ncbi:unnamed protein product [Sphagnum balticum]
MTRDERELGAQVYLTLGVNQVQTAPRTDRVGKNAQGRLNFDGVRSDKKVGDYIRPKGHVFQLQHALEYFAKLIDVLEELHINKLVYRNVRAEKIRIKVNEPYLYDFSMSQFTKRK